MTKHLRDTERWKKIVQSFGDVSVTVLADLVADEFIFGEIARVSREAPVLILKHRERTVVPGGGANAVMNLASLGVNVLPVGVVGDDEAGSLLLERLHEKKIPTSGIERLKHHTTTTKSRILAGMSHTSRQQVVRVDREAGTAGRIASRAAEPGECGAGICDRVGCISGFRLRIRRGHAAAAELRQVEPLPGRTSRSLSTRAIACWTTRE